MLNRLGPVAGDRDLVLEVLDRRLDLQVDAPGEAVLLRIHLLDERMLVAVFARQLGLVPLQPEFLLAQRHDQRRGQQIGHDLSGIAALQKIADLAQLGFPGGLLGLGVDQFRAQRQDLLAVQVGAVGPVEPMRRPVLLDRAFEVEQHLTHLLDPSGQPVLGSARGRELVAELALDVGVGDAVGELRRAVRARCRVADREHVRVAGLGDLQAPAQRADRPQRDRLRISRDLRGMSEAGRDQPRVRQQVADRAEDTLSANWRLGRIGKVQETARVRQVLVRLDEPDLGLDGRTIGGQALGHLLEIDNPGVLWLDHHERGRGVGFLDLQADQRGHAGDQQDDPHDHPSPPPQNRDQLAQWQAGVAATGAVGGSQRR